MRRRRGATTIGTWCTQSIATRSCPSRSSWPPSATRLDLDSLTAGATAVTPLVSVAADCSIAEAGSLMAQFGIAHLAVIDPEFRRPIGVISTLDIARAVAAGLGPRETFASA